MSARRYDNSRGFSCSPLTGVAARVPDVESSTLMYDSGAREAKFYDVTRSILFRTCPQILDN
jgi:hypothetical protein